MTVATTKPQQTGDTPPNPRKLREKVMMALISTSSTSASLGRAANLVEEAEKIVAYILGE